MKLLNSEFLIEDSELLKRASYVIKAAINNDKDGIIDIFEAISLPFDKENYKKQLFHMIFDLAKIDNEWSTIFGLVIYSEKRTKTTVVSHMDLIPKFNKGFRENKFYKIEDDKLIGALDNTFTNAVLINHILNNRNKNTTYLFTLDEETNQHSMRDYMRAYGTEQFIINLDVTNDGWNQNMSIEYDEPSWEICRQIDNNLDNPFFTTDRVGDDFDEVVKAKGYGFSYCIPTSKVIHSYNNYTLLEKIEPYMDGLEYIIQDLDTSERKHNIEYIEIDKAIKCKTIKNLKEKDVRKVYKSSGITYTHLNYADEKGSEDSQQYDINGRIFNQIAGRKEYLSYDITDDNFYNGDSKYDDKKVKLVADIVLALSMSNQDDFLNVSNFLGITLYKEDAFTSYDLLKTVSKKLFDELYYYTIIKKVSKKYYVFNIDVIKESNFKIYKVLLKDGGFDALRFYKYLYQYTPKNISCDSLLTYEKGSNVLRTHNVLVKLEKKGLLKEKKNGLYKFIK